MGVNVFCGGCSGTGTGNGTSCLGGLIGVGASGSNLSGFGRGLMVVSPLLTSLLEELGSTTDAVGATSDAVISGCIWALRGRGLMIASPLLTSPDAVGTTSDAVISGCI